MNLNSILNDSKIFLGPNKLVSKKQFKLNYDQFNDKNIKKILQQIGFKKGERIAYISTYKKNYTRTEALKNIFERNKINVDYYIFPKNYFKMMFSLMKIRKKYTYFFVAFRGHETLPITRFLVGKKKKIIFDAFVSIYDTLCSDRKKFNPKSFLGKSFKKYDSWLGKLSDVVLVDTKTHSNYFKKEFNLKNVDYLFVGCNKKLFKKINVAKNKNKFVILWYGSANPLQGVENILKWAKSLEKDPKIKFKLIGPIRKKYSALIKELNLRNVEFIDYVPYEKLPLEINKADLCLGGHFSNIPKAKRVIAGKTFQMIEICPTLISVNKANEELF